METKKIQYPELLQRVKAITFDTIILIVLATIFSYIFGLFESTLEPIRGFLFFFLFFLYEPLFTSLGGTLGHRMNGLRVVTFDELENTPLNKRINILSAYIRFVVKGLLGVVSFFTIHSDKHRRAIHDKASGAVLIVDAKENFL